MSVEQTEDTRGQPAASDEVKIDSVERLASMSLEEVDDLPYGFIVLDTEGQVLLYNRYEARMSRVAPERVIGQNFFRDIAPCTRSRRSTAAFGRSSWTRPGRATASPSASTSSTARRT